MVPWYVAFLREMVVMGLGQHTMLFPLTPLTFTSFSACGAQFLLPPWCITSGTERRKDIFGNTGKKRQMIPRGAILNEYLEL